MPRSIFHTILIVCVLLPLFGASRPPAAAAPAEAVYILSLEGNTVEEISADYYYRASGTAVISIVPNSDSEYTRTVVSAAATCIGTPNPCGGQTSIAFDIDEAGTATGMLDVDALPTQDWPLPYVVYQVTGKVYVDVLSQEGGYNIPFNHYLYLTKHRMVSFNDTSGNIVSFAVFKGDLVDGIRSGRPLAGEVVTPESSVFRFEPSSNTTDEYGRAYFYMTPMNTDGALAAGAAAAPGADFINGQVAVDISGEQNETFSAGMAYARVSCLRGVVFKVDGLGNTTVLKMDDTLLPGDIVKLTGAETDPQGNERYPMICLDFFNGQRHIAESAFAKEGSWINIQIGPDGVSGILEKSWKIDLQNLKLDITENHREYLRLAVYHLTASRLVAPLKWGWIATTAAKKAVETALRKAFGSNQSLALSGPSLPALGLAGSSGLAAPGSEMGFTIPYLAVTFMGDGSARVTNWSGQVEISSQDVDTHTPLAGVVLPTGTRSSVDGEYTAFSPVEKVPGPVYPGTITIAPAGGSHLSAPPQISVTYPWNVMDPVIQSTLDVRLNGTAISPYMVQTYSTSGTAAWQSPAGWPFLAGENLIEAYILARSGTVYTATATFTIDLVPPEPRFLKAYRSSPQTILRWQAPRHADLAGYRVYRASSESGSPTLLTTEPITETIYVTDQAGWYWVAAVNGQGSVGPLAGPVLGDPDPSAGGGAPAPPHSFAVTPGEATVTVTFDADAFVPFYRLERASSDTGPFTSLANLTSSPYVDRAVATGETYWYRLVAVGAGLAESVPAGPLLAALSDQTPQAPEGFSARFESGAVVRLTWNPAPETDLAGYNLYRSELFGAFRLVNAEPLTGTTTLEAVGGDSGYAWRITALDQGGNESLPSTILELSTWFHPPLALNQKIYLPSIARP